MTNARLEELRTRFQENPRRYFAPFANELRKTGDSSQAISICRTHLATQPGHVSGHIVLAQALHEAGEVAEARGVFTAALELDPENLIALRTMGDMAYADGEFADARHWYERLLDADPRNPEIVQLLSHLPESVPESSSQAPVAAAVEDVDRAEALPGVESAAESVGMAAGDVAAAGEPADVDLVDGLMAAVPEVEPGDLGVQPIDLQAPVDDTEAHEHVVGIDMESFLSSTADVPAADEAAAVSNDAQPMDEHVGEGDVQDQDWSDALQPTSPQDTTADGQPPVAAAEPVEVEPALEAGDGWSLQSEPETTLGAELSDWIMESDPETRMDSGLGSDDAMPGAFAEYEDEIGLGAPDAVEAWQAPAGPSDEPRAEDAGEGLDEWSRSAEPDARSDAGESPDLEGWSLPVEPTGLVHAESDLDEWNLGAEPDEQASAGSDPDRSMSAPGQVEFPEAVVEQAHDADRSGEGASEFDLAMERSDLAAVPEPVEAAQDVEPERDTAYALPDEPALASADENDSGDATGSVTTELLSVVPFDVPVEEQDVASAMESHAEPSVEASDGSVPQEPIAAADHLEAPEPEDSSRATFAEHGFEGPAGEADWFASESDPTSHEEPRQEPVASTEVPGAGAETTSPAADDQDWFDDVPAVDYAVESSDTLFMAPDLMSVAPAAADEETVTRAGESASEVEPAMSEQAPVSEAHAAAAESLTSEAEPPSLAPDLSSRAVGMPSAPGESRRETPSSAPFVTETLAELYLKQGYREEAISIYEQLLERDPANASLHERITAIRSQAGEAGSMRTPGRPEPVSSRSVRAFFGSIARRAPSAAAAQARLARTTAEAMGVAPQDRAVRDATEPPFSNSASALANLFSASNPSPADEGAATNLAESMSEPDPGRPARAAERELSLDHLFRDVPGASGATLDDFYGARSDSSGQAAPAGESAGEPDEGETDIRQFTAWLEGLRKK